MMNADGKFPIRSISMDCTVAIVAINTCLFSDTWNADIDGAERMEGLLDFGATFYGGSMKAFGLSEWLPIMCKDKHHPHL